MGRPCICCGEGCGYSFVNAAGVGEGCEPLTGGCPAGGKEGCRRNGWSKTLENDGAWELSTSGGACQFAMTGGAFAKAVWMAPVLCNGKWYPSGYPLRVTSTITITEANAGTKYWMGIVDGFGLMIDGIPAGAKPILLDGDGDVFSSGDSVNPTQPAGSSLVYGPVQLILQINRYGDDTYRWWSMVGVQYRDNSTLAVSTVFKIVQYGQSTGVPPQKLHVVIGCDTGADNKKPEPTTAPPLAAACISSYLDCDICGYVDGDDFPDCFTQDTSLIRFVPPDAFEFSGTIGVGDDHPMTTPNLLPTSGEEMEFRFVDPLSPQISNCDPLTDEQALVLATYRFQTGNVEDGDWVEAMTVSLYKPDDELVENPDPETGLHTMDLLVRYDVFPADDEDSFDQFASATYRCVGFRCDTANVFTRTIQDGTVATFPTTLTVTAVTP